MGSGADLIISDGDDLIPDVLGLRPDGTIGGGALGRMRVDKLVGKDANSAVNVEKGLTITGITTSSIAHDVGSNIKLGAAGVVTATAFHGDGANLTGVSGFATALSNTEGTLENLIFKTPESFTIGAGTSTSIESDNTSGNTLFTRLGRINVATGATFHVSAGTTFIMNVLNVF